MHQPARMGLHGRVNCRFGKLDARLGHKNGQCRAAFVGFNLTAQGIDHALVVYSGACCGAVAEPLGKRFTFGLDHLFAGGPGIYDLAQILVPQISELSIDHAGVLAADPRRWGKQFLHPALNAVFVVRIGP